MTLRESKGGQIRGQMAHQAGRSDLTAGERDAFRTLAAASPEVRAYGIGDFISAGGDEHAAGRTPPPEGPSAATSGGSATLPGSATPPMSQAADGMGAGASQRAGDEDSSPIAAPLADAGPMGSARAAPPPPTARPDEPGEGSSTPPQRDHDDPFRN
jgi:hypothetical protein